MEDSGRDRHETEGSRRRTGTKDRDGGQRTEDRDGGQRMVDWGRRTADGGRRNGGQGMEAVFDNYFSVRCGDANIMTIF